MLNMVYATSRRYTRVNLSQPVRLDFGDRQYEQQFIRTLSLSGMYVTGHFEQQVDDICTIELNQPGAPSEVDLRARGSVVRLDDDGMALKFISMIHDSMLFLQTLLLYAADDPMVFGSEFIKNISFKLEDDE
jgi:hypothetical protein